VLPVSLDCPILIASTVFSYVYLITRKQNTGEIILQTLSSLYLTSHYVLNRKTKINNGINSEKTRPLGMG
jgi:hypothetical protein